MEVTVLTVLEAGVPSVTVVQMVQVEPEVVEQVELDGTATVP
jgi:hypothetical protein